MKSLPLMDGARVGSDAESIASAVSWSFIELDIREGGGYSAPGRAL
jgi:hypothetical protein